MSTLVIPTFSDADDYSFTTTLEGVGYGFQMTWNQRNERWYMNVYDNSGNLLIASIPLSLNWPLLRQFSWNKNLPPGTLYVLDTTDSGQEPSLDDLGDRCLLMYIESTGP